MCPARPYGGQAVVLGKTGAEGSPSKTGAALATVIGMPRSRSLRGGHWTPRVSGKARRRGVTSRQPGDRPRHRL